MSAIFFRKAEGGLSPEEAAALVRNGALVIDVRTPDEFNAGHLERAINIPLGEIESAVPNRIKDTRQVLLLHCLSGGRSAAAERKLRCLGYNNAFNLGSYRRAATLLSQA